MNWGESANRIVRKIETQLRCLVGEIAFVHLTERQDKFVAPLMRTHRASGQNMNVAYIEDLDKVVIMSHDPQVVILQGKNGRMEIVKELSEDGLSITSKAPIGGLFAQGN